MLVGAVVSVDLRRGDQAPARVVGCAPMSARMLSVAWRIRGSAGWTSSRRGWGPGPRPTGRCRRRRPVRRSAARYWVRWWVVVPGRRCCRSPAGTRRSDRSWSTAGSARPVGSRCRRPRRTRSRRCGRPAWPSRRQRGQSVFRQRRSLPSSALTLMARSTELAMYCVPVRLFSGPQPRSPNRGSRQVGGRSPGRADRVGRPRWPRCPCSRQRAVRRVAAVLRRLPAGLPVDLVAAEEGQVDPGVTGGLTFVRWSFDQYSSCPTDRNILCFVSRAGSTAVSRPET